jgi:hypothetical protein
MSHMIAGGKFEKATFLKGGDMYQIVREDVYLILWMLCKLNYYMGDYL